jgi:hypothetical protein
MTKKWLLLVAVVCLFLCTGVSVGKGPAAGAQDCCVCGQCVDADGDGICDLCNGCVPQGDDDDGDGIPNGQDDDYVPPQDGSGSQKSK